MAKKAARMSDTIDLVKPYLERALRDEEFRTDLKDALNAARELYGVVVDGPPWHLDEAATTALRELA